MPSQLQLNKLIFALNEAKISYTFGWQNYAETIDLPEAIVVEIEKEKQVPILVQIINAINQTQDSGEKIVLRAVAGWSDEDHKTNFPFLSNFTCFNKKKIKERYNESFSWTHASVSNVYLRFSPKFHSIKINTNQPRPLPPTTVTVSAGTQISEIVKTLWKAGYSLPTCSMIPHVSAVGLAATGGHGAGRQQPSFAGLITHMRICNYKGEIVAISMGDKYFESVRGAHMGLFGIVLSITIRCVPRFFLQEQRIPITMDHVEQNLLHIISNHDYTTLIAVPTYEHLQIRLWDKVDESSFGTVKRIRRQVTNTIDDATQHFSVETGASILDIIMKHSQQEGKGSHAIPTFLNLVGEMEIGHDSKHYIDKEKNISHDQIAFPKELTDYSVLFPIDLKDDAKNTFYQQLQFLWGLLEQYADSDQYPVTYAVYARFFKGTAGGLSTSALASKNKNKITCALEVVSHKDNPYFESFRDKLTQHFLANVPGVRFHLGKYIPENVTVADIYTSEEVNRLREAILHWYDDDLANFEAGPFTNAFLSNFLNFE